MDAPDSLAARKLADMIRGGLSSQTNTDAIAHDGRWRTRGWLLTGIAAIDQALREAAVSGLVARNRPHHIAAYAANLLASRPTVMIHAAQRPAGLARDIGQLRLPAIMADQDDWSAEALHAARETGTRAVALGERGGALFAEVLHPGGSSPFRPRDPAVALELLSSGTTGPPRQIPLRWSSIAAVVEGAAQSYAGSQADAPQIMVHPLGNVAGLAYATPPLAFGRPLVLLDRFTARGWAEAVRDYRPVRGTIPPAGVRMLLESEVPRAWLASLALVAVGGGSLDTARQSAFEKRFGVPILPAFGATEFGGVIANWSLDSYHRWGEAKRGSAGRAGEGVALRIADRDSLAPLRPGEIGLLEARVDRMGPDWIRTTDLASLDEDGFLFLHGRADNAINRGGFKILPDMVASVLAGHPAVADAVVVGLADDRLGEVPVAAVELRSGEVADRESLTAWLRDRVLAYQLPVDIRIVAALPRNASMKIALHEVRALFASA